MKYGECYMHVGENKLQGPDEGLARPDGGVLEQMAGSQGSTPRFALSVEPLACPADRQCRTSSNCTACDDG
jgi:hypothetical protein